MISLLFEQVSVLCLQQVTATMSRPRLLEDVRQDECMMGGFCGPMDSATYVKNGL